MAGTIGQVSFFVALILVILIHEAGHFSVAKWFGFKVEEFFVGFGPRLWSFRRGETEYGLKAIPAGGYVKISGMNPFQEPPEADLPRTYGAKPIWQRALLIFAGPATHFILALVFFAVWLGAIGDPRIPLIERVTPRLNGEISPAAAAGILPGDQVIAVGPIDDPTDIELVQYTRDHVGETITLVIRRGDRVLEGQVTPVLSTVEGERVGRIGVFLSVARDREGIVGSITGSAKLIGAATADTVTSFGRIFGPEGVGRVFELLFTDAPRESGDAASVVGIGRVAGQAAESNFGDILWVLAVVNVFIGLLNLLPLPPFDGGHLAVLAVEKIRGRRVDMRKLVPVSAVVATFLILFTLSIVYLDITKPINLVP
jgi:membrane-associated protease RseP (regulator of RpoE activity)